MALIARPARSSLAILALLFVGCLQTSGAEAEGATQLWVSPTGSDDDPGSRHRPFATLTAARNAIRDIPQSGQSKLRVNLHGGLYRLTSPLRLDSRDSGAPNRDIVWRAAAGARPTLSGAIAIDDWRLVDETDQIYRAKVPQPQAGERVETRQLFVNGRRAVRARGPENPEGFYRTAGGYTAPDESMARWRNPRGIELVTDTQWKSMRCPVAAIEGSEITMQEPCWTNANVFPHLWSFQLISRIENAYELLDQPGEWYLDEPAGWLYYIPRPGEEMSEAQVELPVLEQLIAGHGTRRHPIENIRFEGLTFEHATWLGPSGANGYPTDQGGFHLTGTGHEPNPTGHDPHTTRTPGSVSFRFGRNLGFRDDVFAHLGAVGLDLSTGAQGNEIVGNRFRDTSGAAIQVGGVAKVDHHPPHRGQVTRDNRIANNVIRRAGREYLDAPGIALGFTSHSTVAHNDISDVPWAGIAIGWGWGLVDPGAFPGVEGAEQMTERQIEQWGVYDTPTTSRNNRIVNNRIRDFLISLWDGGAIYSLGQQGRSMNGGELIAGNVATEKRPAAGGNVFYTDGGSRFVTLRRNVSVDNPQGTVDFGPCLENGTSLNETVTIEGAEVVPCELTGKIPYGLDRGGCRPRSQIAFISNYFEEPDYFLPCPYNGHPTHVLEEGNVTVSEIEQVPQRIVRRAGLERRYRHLLPG